jgi:6-phosphofructokinase 1
MGNVDLNFEITKLGECSVPSPMAGVRFVRDGEYGLVHSNLREIKRFLEEGKDPPSMELAGPREKIYFDPSKLKCGIVTCGGLCPGLNDVIRAIVLSLLHHYGVKTVYGFRFGYEGLVPKYGHAPLEFTPQAVGSIHQIGGTILGSSRGSQDVREMVDTLQRLNIGILFTIGGDGTLRGACAISEEVKRRGLEISVIGIPKTIDNDISYVQMSFGFDTAVSEARRVTCAAHSEAEGARNGIALIKLMGRESGFIAAYSVLADTQVNFCLVPEVPFGLETFREALKERLKRRGHAVIVVAEGAGQDLMEATGDKDASGNIRFADIGLFLRDEIKSFFNQMGLAVNLRYFDPSYTIRSQPANARDAAYCVLLGHNAVHAGMTGRTEMVVSFWRGEFTHLPIPMAISQRKKIEPDGLLWSSVLASTGQPKDLR